MIIGKKRRHRVTVELVFTKDSSTGSNPLIGVVASESDAQRISFQHPDKSVSWETFEVIGQSELVVAGNPLWILIQGGVFADTASFSPSPVAVCASNEDAQKTRSELHAKTGEELLLWQVPLGLVDVNAPDWSYRQI